ncbi:hypothetical protein RTG_01065 [Rhodotorula toruloides ATCC 204091]|uniref:LIM binding protein n=1 Tax=Rhodotorula toruloides TaxID=5286 RepID=A0A0K3CAH3_RHOTO|nr:hypothetical protein RTG_01065 [Rhodotorula toruloides ATCC 204091]KAK4334147.1 hypothetical protein RTBOTA2_002886 [Rhodotorula toruloides]PRQ77307.1 hypothetical protein AAT19DRAFT_8375 [Rhodotorula toruloides]
MLPHHTQQHPQLANAPPPQASPGVHHANPHQQGYAYHQQQQQVLQNGMTPQQRQAVLRQGGQQQGQPPQGGMMPGQPQQGQRMVQQPQQQQGGMMHVRQGMNGAGGPPGAMLPVPPPNMRVAGGMPPQPGQVIGPSHPQHPQHGAWLAQQQQQQQQAYLPQPPPNHYLPQHPPQQAGNPMHRPLPPPGSQQHHYAPSPHPPTSTPSSPNLHPLPHPPGLAASQYAQGGPPPPQQSQQLPLPPPPQQQQYQQGQPGVPPRLIPSAAGMRPSPAAPGGGPSPYHPPSSPQPQQLPQPPPPGQPQRHPSVPNGVLPHGRPAMMRPSLAPPPNTLLAAHLALNGTGPITATAVPAGPALARLATLNDSLQVAFESENPLEALRAAVADNFTDTGVVKIGLFDPAGPMSKVFEIPCSAFPRFQHLNHLQGVVSSTFVPTFVREFRLTTPDPTAPRPPSPPSPSFGGPDPPPPTPPSFPIHIGYLLRSEHAQWTSLFGSGTRVELHGTLTMHIMFKDLGNGAAGLRIESLEFDARGYEEFVSRHAMEKVEQALADAVTGAKASGSGEAGGKKAAKQEEEKEHEERRGSSGKGKKGQAKGMVTRRRSASAKVEADSDDILPDERGAGTSKKDEDERKGSMDSVGQGEGGKGGKRSALVEVPLSSVGVFGVTEMGMRCLEIAESVAQLQDLIAFSLESGTGPMQSLARYADRSRPGLPQDAGSFRRGPKSSLPPTTPAASGPPPIAASSQNPSTNSFYSSVTASPGGPPQPLPTAPQRPPSSAAHGRTEMPSPAAAKRKLDAGRGNESGGMGERMEGDPGSPQKVQRGAGGGRGRGRGR